MSKELLEHLQGEVSWLRQELDKERTHFRDSLSGMCQQFADAAVKMWPQPETRSEPAVRFAVSSDNDESKVFLTPVDMDENERRQDMLKAEQEDERTS